MICTISQILEGNKLTVICSAGNVKTVDYFVGAGISITPTIGDYAVLTKVEGSGRWACVGIISEQAQSVSINTIADVSVKATGSVTIESEANVTVTSTGTTTVNGATITADGQVITKLGINVDTHTHNVVTPQGTFPTTPPL